MKNLILLFAVLIFSSCNSDDYETSAKKTLEGKWNWIQSSGGFAGTTSTPESSKKVVYIEFSGSSFKTFIDGKLAAESTFAIKKQKSMIWGDERAMIVSTDPKTYFVAMTFEIKEDKLFLSEECSDCFGSSYVRIK